MENRRAAAVRDVLGNRCSEVSHRTLAAGDERPCAQQLVPRLARNQAARCVPRGQLFDGLLEVPVWVERVVHGRVRPVATSAMEAGFHRCVEKM
jgi:hypothetical protein